MKGSVTIEPFFGSIGIFMGSRCLDPRDRDRSSIVFPIDREIVEFMVDIVVFGVNR
jgi:hypothetical protein